MYQLNRSWQPSNGLMIGLRSLFEYKDDRATGWLYLPDRAPFTPWPPVLAEAGPFLLGRLYELTRRRFTAVCFQAYRNGAGVDWHDDRDWGMQAILSCGVTRSFGIRRDDGEEYLQLADGDLLVMDGSREHCVPAEDIPGERLSIVFRTINEG